MDEHLEHFVPLGVGRSTAYTWPRRLPFLAWCAEFKLGNAAMYQDLQTLTVSMVSDVTPSTTSIGAVGSS